MLIKIRLKAVLHHISRFANPHQFKLEFGNPSIYVDGTFDNPAASTQFFSWREKY